MNNQKTTNNSNIQNKPIIKKEEVKKIEPKLTPIKKEMKEEIKSSDNKYEEIADELKKDIEDKQKKDTKKNKEEVKKTKQISKYNEKKIITNRDKFVYNKKDKPKLAIIIDDVTTSKQKKDILNVGYKITMAFLPPTSGHKNSAKIAQNLPFYMIHFPLQASASFKGYEENTLNITDSYSRVEKRVKNLRNWYPKARYVNNHTGSVFTQNHQAVDRLFKALKKYNFRFLDSRTTSKSVIKKYAKKYGMPYIVRNTFLDNTQDFSYVQNQLKKAIKKAKQNGYAIAIGHPYKITLKVLKQSKHLLKGLDLIYLKDLPYLN